MIQAQSDLVQRDALLQDFCPVGSHDLATTQVFDPESPNFLGVSKTWTMVFCTKCPFHYFPQPPKDASGGQRIIENDPDVLQDD